MARRMTEEQRYLDAVADVLTHDGQAATQRWCEVCRRPIPQARLAALPLTTTCVRCSSERPRREGEVEVDGPDPRDLAHDASMPSGENSSAEQSFS
jgi:RNA polymerase-binding transcription factor DksA